MIYIMINIYDFSIGLKMPQLDIFSYFSATTTLVVLFLSLIFILHTYYLPKIAEILKFRNKIMAREKNQTNTEITTKTQTEEPFLELASKYINEMESVIKKISK